MENTNLQTATTQLIKLYPNPTTESIQISGFEGNAMFVVSDFFCRVLLKKEIVCDELISLKTLSRGVYIAKIITKSGIERKKLEKK
ncbi:MAG: T9SS type A sorting domain-containing protein [Paludibacter sp.]|nr:T9SS type A sorting domain-containing protein [Paludibacter sp.]